MRVQENKVFLITAVGIAAIFVMWALYSYLLNKNFDSTQSHIRAEIIKWNYEISDKIYKKEDLKFVRKKIDDLGSQPLASYSVLINGNQAPFIKWPESRAKTDSCKPYSESLSISSGIKIGTFNFCISKSRIIRNTILSTEFLVPLILVFFGVLLLSSIMTLNSYKRGLNYMIDFFSQNRDSRSIENLSYTKDQLTSKVLSFIKRSFQSELDLNQTQVELSAEKELSRLSQSIAHDSKKAIQKMKEGLYLYTKTRSDEDLERVDRYIYRIEQIYEDLGSNEVNKYSMRLNKPELLDVTPILKEIASDHASLNTKTKMKLTITDDSLKAICHPVEFRRIVENLVQNSLEAIEHKKGLIEIKCFKDGEHLTLQVKDNGKGIPENILPYIFEEKFTHGKKGGIGIGLYSVKRRIFSWLGSIDVDSKENIGTTFTIKLKNEEAFRNQKPVNHGEMTI